MQNAGRIIETAHFRTSGSDGIKVPKCIDVSKLQKKVRENLPKVIEDVEFMGT